jgi:hypothetical protein
MKVFHFLVLASIFCLFNTAQAQPPKLIVVGAVPDSTWMTKHSGDILKSMKLTYNKPIILDEVMGTECFKDNAQLEGMFNCLHHQLHSKDGQFIVFITINKPVSELRPRVRFELIDNQHTYQIRNVIRESLGKEAPLNWKKYVTYLNPRKTKTKFNADTAIFLPLSFIGPEYYYKGKYNNLESLWLQKKGRGWVNFYCFYTDEAKKKLPKYRKAVEGIFRYEN